MADRLDAVVKDASTSRERSNRSRSRGRNEFIRGSVSPVSRTVNRSSSRASFLGRPRQRTYLICEDEEGEAIQMDRTQQCEDQTATSVASQRWRSESRTVRGSLDSQDEGFAFSEDESDAVSKAKPRGRRLSSRAPPERKHDQTSNPTTLIADSSPSDTTQKEAEPHPHQKPILLPQNSQNKDVEAQSNPSEKPLPRLSHLPYPVAHFLGYRTKDTQNKALLRPVEKLPRKIETLVWAFIGAMLGLGFVMITFSRWPKFASSINDPVTEWTAPIVIGSFGASSVILYGTPASPLGQPRAFIGGQFISALVSVCITKLFELNHDYDPNLIDSSHSLVWIAGGIAAATALCAMILTDTVHPPGGATALLGATSPPVIRLGWKYLPVVLLSSVIMQAWALLWMNLGRAKYPNYWFWPEGHPNEKLVSKLRPSKRKTK